VLEEDEELVVEGKATKGSVCVAFTKQWLE
jgi:hypothetical protein